MYDLVKDLAFQDEISLRYGYRYDFIRFLRAEMVESDPIHGSVFVFRKEIKGSPRNRILIDIIDSSHVNAFDIALHNDAHIHIVELDEMYERLNHSASVKKEITKDIDILLIQNDSSVECHALIKKQQYQKLIRGKEPMNLYFEEVKYLLYIEYDSNVVNMYRRFLAPVFSLQEEYIFANAQYRNIERYPSIANILELQEDMPWSEVQMKIKEKSEELQKEKDHIKNKILDIIDEQVYIP